MTEEQKTTETVTPETAAPEFDPADIEKNKVMAGLAYILFFLPLVACPESKFGKFHANQGLLVLIFSVAVAIVNMILAFIPVIGWILGFLLWVAYVVLFVMGLINGFTGKAKELPVIGKIRIIK